MRVFLYAQQSAQRRESRLKKGRSQKKNKQTVVSDIFQINGEQQEIAIVLFLMGNSLQMLEAMLLSQC